jgi:serine/threonine-protein kinase
MVAPSNAPLIAGRYLLHGELGTGGMATVHLGRDMAQAGAPRTVAIKRLWPQFAQDEKFVAMLMDEARLVARIRHPNVVPVLDCVQGGGELVVVVEYVAGESLAGLAKAASAASARMPPAIATGIVLGVLAGLHAAHEARDERGQPLGIVHRDVSPGNVLVGVDGVARVIDFGIAKAAGRTQTTRPGVVKGKVGYMAPEQASSSGVTAQADVYAAAVVLWEALTGERLFGGDVDEAVLGRVLAGVVAPPSSRAPGIGAALDAVVMRGLDRDLARRFPTADAMAQALVVACPPAPAAEIGAWVARTAAVALAERARRVAELERAKTEPPPPPGGVAQGAPDPRAGGSRPVITEVVPAMPYEATMPEPPELPALVRPREVAWGSMAPPAPPPPPAADASAWRRPLTVAAVGGAVVATVAAVAFMMLANREGQAGGATPSARPTASGPPPLVSSVASVAVPPPAACPPGMLPIPGGKFFMGSDDPDSLPFERPAHKVVLAPYCIDRFEVTVEKYLACTARGACPRPGLVNEGWDAEITRAQHAAYDPVCNAVDPEARHDHPINCVDWSMADMYCHAGGGRLPTEAEWEFAARGPDGRKYPWGDDEPTAKLLNACGPECAAWGKQHGVAAETSPPMYRVDDGFATTAPVGSFPAGKSRYGVEDVVGNVWEWVGDWYAEYPAADATGAAAREWTDPKGPDTGDRRVVRGGGWNGTRAAWVRPTFRFREKPTMKSHGFGFRCARSR